MLPHEFFIILLKSFVVTMSMGFYRNQVTYLSGKPMRPSPAASMIS